ncbi:MAG: GGDEF domain-containing protein [Gammaproteobacteria bacterium]|nr:GGDEF domain-containing protein [Gammaproteobacteria bacterium]
MIISDKQVEFERIQILYNSAPRVVVGMALLILFLGFFLKEHIPLSYVVIWVCASLGALLPRMVVAKKLKRGLQTGKVTPDNIGIWERRWIYSVIPTVGSVVAALFLPLENEHLLIVALFLCILGAGNLVTSSVSMKSVAVTGGMIMIPLASRMFMIGESYFNLLGYMFLACIVVFGNYALSLNRTLIENIQLKIESDNLSLIDMLTGLHNRRGLYMFVEKMLPHAIRYEEPFGVIIIDIDHFKAYNDTHGHARGDEALIGVAECIRNETRHGDMVVRYGGEEFLIVLPNTNDAELEEVAHRVCDLVRKSTDMTISAGVASFAGEADFDLLVKRADDALYVAKNKGRDCYVVNDTVNDIIPAIGNTGFAKA